MTQGSRDIRDAFFEEIYAAGSRDANLVIITNDMDVFALRKFKEEHPDRFVNVGVAEQNMINVAAGLATCGKSVLIYGISSFITYRCYEQLRFCIGSMRLPVILAGIGPGFSFAFDGPTHHGTQDLAVMRAIPEFSIYNPGDVVAAQACARQVLAGGSPAYVRIDKGAFPELHREQQGLGDGFGILRPLADTNILATGYMTARALEVADALRAQGREVGVVDVFRLKPFSERLATEVIGPSRRLVTLEETAHTGGFGSAIGELIVDRGLPARLLRLATADEQVLRYGSREWMLAQNKLDRGSLIQRIAAFAQSS